MRIFLDSKHFQATNEFFSVSFHCKNIVGLLALEPVCKILSAVKGIDGYYFAANIDRIEKWSYFMNLAGFIIDPHVAQRLSIAVCHRRKNMYLPAIYIPGCLKDLAVNRQGFGGAAACEPIIELTVKSFQLNFPKGFADCGLVRRLLLLGLYQ